MVTNPRPPRKIASSPAVSRATVGATARATTRATGRSTLADVAKLAGVTTMTVSRYLREPGRVSPVTSAHIEQALQATGYAPNKQAGGLASGKSPVIAAIIPNVGNSRFAETVQALCEVFQAAGYELLLSATNYSLEREEEQVRAMLGWMPSALIITGRRHTSATLHMMRTARDRGLPVIEMWDTAPASTSCAAEFIQVGFNHHAVGTLMAQHLIERGYDDLAYVDSGVTEDFRAHERGLGFVQHATQAGCRVNTLIGPRGEPIAAGRAVLRDLSPSHRPRALAFANDPMAAGAYLHAQATGLSVPETLALLGFGDLPLAAELGAGISSVVTQCYEIGQVTATRALMELGQMDAVADAGAAITPELCPLVVQRGST